MDNLEVMQILQAICDVNQLRGVRQLPVEIVGVTHKHKAVGMWIHLDELVYVPILHPLRNHRKLVSTYCHPKER